MITLSGSSKNEYSNSQTTEGKQNSHPKLYEVLGAQYSKEATVFRVYAPHAKNVSAILTAFGKPEHSLELQKNNKGVWETTTALAQAGRTYLYDVEDCNGKKMLRTDPFSFSMIHVPELNQIQSVVVDQSSYQWNDGIWLEKRAQTKPLEAPLSIYEIQVKSWVSGYNNPLNFKDLAPKMIDYCKKMGFTHVECYGLLEHYSRSARGYQVSNFFSTYRDCGDSNDFKYFVDQLHQNEIGVIIDWIPTHFQHYHESNSYSVSIHEFDGTNLYASEKSPWGTLYLDFQKKQTYEMMMASALYYLDQFHIDGIRFDAVSQMIRRKGADILPAISFLKELNDIIHRCYPGVVTIAEETEGYPNVTVPTEKGGLGFDVKWNIGWSHDSRNFLRTPYKERPQQWQHKVIDFLNSTQHGEKTLLTHSHDDTDAGENSNGKVLMECVSHLPTNQERWASIRNFFAFQTTAPSYGKMLHMGDEIVQPESWYQRLRKNETCVDWSLLNSKESPSSKMQECVKDLNKLYLDSPQFWKKGAKDFKWISEHGPNGVVAYHRGTQDSKRLAVIHNFSNVGYPTYDVPLSNFSDQAVRRIKNVSEKFNTDLSKYGGSEKFVNREIKVIRDPNSQDPTHLRLSLPPHSTLVLEEELV